VSFDSHNHLQNSERNARKEILARAEKAGVTRMMCCASGAEGDWDRLTALIEDHPATVLASYGLHPWWIGGAPADWKRRLEARLEGNASGIGEIGLDKSPRCKASLTEQEAAFAWQLDLAREGNRPVSIHCVHAWEELFRALRGREGQRLLFHGFAASGEIARELVRRGVHLSIGGALLRMPSGKAHALLAEIPSGLLHFESDYAGPRPGASLAPEPGDLPLVVECAARLLGRDAHLLGEEAAASSEAFFSATIPS
jgi:TatD DNase family protein